MGKRILCLGDSNTYGYDPRSPLGGRYPKSVRWTGRLRLSGLDVLNFGQNGLSIPVREQDRVRFRDLIMRNQPTDLVTVMLGSNDLLQSSTPDAEEVGRRMEDFLRSVMVPGVRFLLIAPPPMKRGTWVTDDRLLDESASLAQCYLNTAETLGIAFTDAWAWNVDLTFDGVHFSPEGHASFAAGCRRYWTACGRDRPACAADCDTEKQYILSPGLPHLPPLPGFLPVPAGVP